MKLDGAVNFRDAGGYRTADGHWVKMGEIYRSDALDKLTAADLAKLKRLGIRVDYDLRTASERTAAPDRVPSGARYVVADVLAGSSTMTSMPTTEAAAVRMMVDGEKFMVSGDTARAAYGTVFAGVADPSRRALLYHCTAGKDRTGWSSAALLTALGVPRSTVMADYLASNTYRAAANAATLAAMPPAAGQGVQAAARCAARVPRLRLPGGQYGVRVVQLLCEGRTGDRREGVPADQEGPAGRLIHDGVRLRPPAGGVTAQVVRARVKERNREARLLRTTTVID